MSRRPRLLGIGLAAVVVVLLAVLPIPAHAAGTAGISGAATLGWALDGSKVVAPAGSVRVTYGTKTSPSAAVVWNAQGSVVTTAGGRYSFTGLDDGRYAVRFEYIGSSPTRFESVVQDGGGTGIVVSGGMQTVAGDLGRYITVSGHVEVGTSGRSAVRDEVIVSFRRSAGGIAAATTTTDATGRYSIEILQGDWLIDFTHARDPQRYPTVAGQRRYGPGYTGGANSVSITSSNQGVADYDQIVVSATGIWGQVGAPSAPQPGITITLDRYDPTTFQYLGSYTAESQDDGYYFIETEPGLFYAYFEDPERVLGSAAWASTSFYDIPDVITVERGSLQGLGGIYLYPGAVLTGSVSGGGVTAEEFAAGDVRIGVEYHDFSDGWVDAGWSWPVKADGTFRIDALAAGYHVYRFRAYYDGPRGYAEMVSPTMTFDAGGDRTWSAALPAPAVLDLTVYRFWSEANQSHFYTADVAERDRVISAYTDREWLYEGAAYTALAAPVGGAMPLYRFWSDLLGGHFYTVSSDERDYVIDAFDDSVWHYEGIAYYVLPVDRPVPGSQPVARFWSSRSQHHFYTADADEAAFVKRAYPTDVWDYEGDAFRVFPVTPSASALLVDPQTTPLPQRHLLEAAPEL